MISTEIIRKLCESRDITIAKLEKELHLGNGTIASSKSSYMRSDRLKAVSDYFGVTMEYLMTGESSTPASSGHFISDFEFEIIKTYRQLSTDQKAMWLRSVGLELPEAGKERGTGIA